MSCIRRQLGNAIAKPEPYHLNALIWLLFGFIFDSNSTRFYISLGFIV